MIGEVIGNHRVTARIADGVTGTVYRAEHTVIGRAVAIKFLRAEYSTDPRLVQRFFSQLRAISALEHPNIVELFDFGYHRDAAYLVMEFMEYETLDMRIRRDGRMRMSFALQLVRQVNDALTAVHGAGLMHENLAADNIAILPDPAMPGGERAKILDFGLATLLTDPATGARQVRNEAELPYYSAPEQLAGPEDVDHRADLYALGVIWYQMICGRKPFVSRDVMELMDQLLSVEPVPPRALIPAISREVEEVVLRLLAKQPAARVQSAVALADALDELQGDFMEDISSVAARPSLAKIRFATYRPELDEPMDAATRMPAVTGQVHELTSTGSPAPAERAPVAPKSSLVWWLAALLAVVAGLSAVAAL